MHLYESEAEIYRALGDPIRLRILALLRVREACVCELVARLPVSQPAVSQHLRKLRQAGILGERKRKYWNYYAIRKDLDPSLKEIIARLPEDEEDRVWIEAHRVDSVCGAPPAETRPWDHDTEEDERGALIHGR